MDVGHHDQGFVLNRLAITLIAVAPRRAAPALPRYAQRVGFVVLVGLAATVLTEIGDAVWWEID